MPSSAAPSGNQIRVLIADDHPLLREGLISILSVQDDIKVVGEARDGEETCELYDRLEPDIVIVDLRMPKKDGLEVITELMSRTTHPQIIVLTSSEKAAEKERKKRVKKKEKEQAR